ncbi:hypothetical protein ASG78_00265 [Nostocoides sp. Soil756]|nr:hypothetical protein ASG78_00265 [Tetrasphaera sp. Soil756]
MAASLPAGAMLWATVSVALSFFCMPADHAYADRLSSSEWLSLHPVGAEPTSAPSADCEDDDKMAMGTRTFRRGGLTMAEVQDFYAQSLTGQGWTLGEGSSSCWNREQGGKSISLAVYTGDDPLEYELQLSSSRDGGGWCQPDTL